MKQNKYIFGPVPSRRLGYSLGIDIIPYKTCNFDCVYCELGKTTLKLNERKDFKNSKEIINEVLVFLKNYNEHIDYITFSGSGEPTLNLKLGYIARKIKEKTDIPLAIITNSTLLSDKNVRKELSIFDVVLPSIDAFDEHTFKKINNPHESVDLKKILKGLALFAKNYKGKILMEVLFVKGLNDSNKNILELRKFIQKVKITKLQINTVVRPPAYKGYKPIDEEDRERIKSLLGDIADIEMVFSKNEKYNADAGKENVVSLLSRRPCKFDDISASLGIHIDKLRKILDELKNENKLVVENFNNEFYYRVKNE